MKENARKKEGRKMEEKVGVEKKYLTGERTEEKWEKERSNERSRKKEGDKVRKRK